MSKKFHEITTKVGSIIEGMENDGYTLNDMTNVANQLTAIVEARRKSEMMEKARSKMTSELDKRMKQLGKFAPSKKPTIGNKPTSISNMN